jgi:putative ABC transport system substrate-binding protein
MAGHGFSHFELGIGAKWLELLKEIAANVTRVAVLYDPANAASTGYLPSMEIAARALALDIVPSPVRDNMEIERVLEALGPWQDSRTAGLFSYLVRSWVRAIG